MRCSRRLLLMLPGTLVIFYLMINDSVSAHSQPRSNDYGSSSSEGLSVAAERCGCMIGPAGPPGVPGVPGIWRIRFSNLIKVGYTWSTFFVSVFKLLVIKVHRIGLLRNDGLATFVRISYRPTAIQAIIKNSFAFSPCFIYTSVDDAKDIFVRLLRSRRIVTNY